VLAEAAEVVEAAAEVVEAAAAAGLARHQN